MVPTLRAVFSEVCISSFPLASTPEAERSECAPGKIRDIIQRSDLEHSGFGLAGAGGTVLGIPALAAKSLFLSNLLLFVQCLYFPNLFTSDDMGMSRKKRDS
jgi:hypothetical protein